MSNVKYYVFFLKHWYLVSVPFIAMAASVFFLIRKYWFISIAFLLIGLYLSYYYRSEYNELMEYHRKMQAQRVNNKIETESQRPDNANEFNNTSENKNQESSSIPGINNNSEPSPVMNNNINENKIKIPDDIDISDKTKTTITISNSLKKYLDRNKSRDETFNDELIRLLFNK